MNIGQSIREAFESVVANKLRAFLTILGIVIGVAAVIAMLAVGTGAQDTILGSISGIGTNLLFVFQGNLQQDVRNQQPITMADVAAIKDVYQAPHVQEVAPIVQGTVNASFSGESTSPEVFGVTPEFELVRNYKLIEGSFITADNVNGQASVALLGPEVADKLFDRRDLITGETIRIEGQPFRVIGILEPKGGGSFGSQDNVILIPLTTARIRLLDIERDNVDVVYVQAINAESVPIVSEEIAQILRTRHRTELGADDFTIFTQEDFLSVAGTITNVLTIFLGGIAAISLLVGGIGIMNIMLVSVTERTKEIGLRKAVGARKADILIQFLTESSLLSLIGGIIGIIFGWLISFGVGRIAAASGTPFTPNVSLNAILLATLFSTAVGLFFGIYPANRAANLEPVEALRYE
ncbi:MAG: ABC transporter permease [Anaerolineaceae bacterium]|jgi:putative ABC transport system permease protein|nr:ABC transporter permease [Anaerolineaceae bacterium]